MKRPTSKLTLGWVTLCHGWEPCADERTERAHAGRLAILCDRRPRIVDCWVRGYEGTRGRLGARVRPAQCHFPRHSSIHLRLLHHSIASGIAAATSVLEALSWRHVVRTCLDAESGQGSGHGRSTRRQVMVRSDRVRGSHTDFPLAAMAQQ